MRIGLFLRVGSLLASALAMVVSALGASPYPQNAKYWAGPSSIMGAALSIIEVTSDAIDERLAQMIAAYHGKSLPVITMFVMDDGSVKVRCYLPGSSGPSEKVIPLAEFNDDPVSVAKLIKVWMGQVVVPEPAAPAALGEVSLEKLSGGAPKAPPAPPAAETDGDVSELVTWAKELLGANVDTVRSRLGEVFPEKPGEDELPALQAKLATVQAEEASNFGDRKGVQVLVTEIIQDYTSLAAQYAVGE